MTALSLVQALIPTTPSSKFSSGTGTPDAGSNAFSLLVPGKSDAGTDAVPEAAIDPTLVSTETSSLEDPSTSLIDILSGAETTNIETDGKTDLLALHVTPEETLIEAVGDLTGVAPGPDGAGAVAQAPASEVTPDGQASAAAVAGVATVPAQAPALDAGASVAPVNTLAADQSAVAKPVAPQAQAGQAGGGTPVAGPVPVLQPKGDVLEGGKGAPAAPQLLGGQDPKTASDAAQRDPAASTLLSGNTQKSAFGANTATGTQQSFAANAGPQNGQQTAFHEVSNQQLRQENAAQPLPPQPVPQQQPRFEIAPPAGTPSDIGASATGQTDGTLVPDQRPPVTVTVRFDQTIHGPQLAAQQLAFHVKRNFANGVNRFEVRLDPPELGRIDVRLDMGADGRIAAALTVDRPETLDLLQRDARLLHKALTEAGVSVEDGALNFSLRDGNEQATGEGGDGGDPGGQTVQGDAPGDELAGPVGHDSVAIIEDDRVDIRV